MSYIYRTESLKGLRGATFTNERIHLDGVQSNAHYVANKQTANFSRATGRDYRKTADLLQRTLAVYTVAHELAHHVYAVNQWVKGEWAQAVKADLKHLRSQPLPAPPEILHRLERL